MQYEIAVCIKSNDTYNQQVQRVRGTLRPLLKGILRSMCFGNPWTKSVDFGI